MSDHDQFEEMCALAAGGALGHEDLQTLRTHLDECYPCRTLFEELSGIHAHLVPERADHELQQDRASDARLRQRILRRAVRSGAHFSRAAQAGTGTWLRTFSWQTRSARILATAAVLLITVGIWASVQILRLPATPAVLTVRTVVPAAPEVMLAASPHISSQKQEELEATAKLLKIRQAELEKLLREQQQTVDALGAGRSEAIRASTYLRQQLEEARASQASAESELARLKTVQATNDAVNIAQQQEIERLNQKFSEQASTLDRERQMLASGREIRDLIAARNLHIIDVYDTDPHGKTSPAFGRVFYTEGKSLVFYAYDLGDDHREKGSIAFYVWGKLDGAPQNVRKLGPFVKDDKGQRRWVFTVTDPKVLAEIDSVFVTIESAEKQEKHPRGKRLLSAFLGAPANHP